MGEGGEAHIHFPNVFNQPVAEKGFHGPGQNVGRAVFDKFLHHGGQCFAQGVVVGFVVFELRITALGHRLFFG